MPRVSVDIDLVYVPINERDSALSEIETALLTIKSTIIQRFPEAVITEKRIQSNNNLTKLFVERNNVQIIIEPNINLRGTLRSVEKINLSARVENLLELTVLDIPLLSSDEVYAGKICAALDRQHPRDLFDIKLLYDHGGITTSIKEAFVVYLASGARPMSELLEPNFLDIRHLYEKEFVGMTDEPIAYQTLIDIRKTLFEDIRKILNVNERKFLLSIKSGEPEWDLLPFNNLKELPAIRWKVFNVNKMTKKKKEMMVDKLKKMLEL